MPGIIEGYAYDIFISYRQKDNKHDGWVTTFVNELKGELESTFKEEISVYFDINPSDGLLENHDVDESLKEKLKCLVFIPVISQTYCDPKSFAWEHEFRTFVHMAAGDRFGLRVKLANGDVTGRVLPVRIHEIDPVDKQTIEKELGNTLRCIDFVFKSLGVNRPLTPSDNPDKNLNKIYYRDQVNKVANAIKEIITALKSQSYPNSDQTFNQPVVVAPVRSFRKKIIWAIVGLSVILAGIFVLPGILKSEDIERSIAVLPFINESPVDSNKYFINGIMEETLNNLQLIKEFRVLSRTSTDKFKGVDKPSIPQIAKELGVNYIVEGSGQKYGSSFRLRVQLIKAERKEDHLWGKSFEVDLKETADLFDIQSQISQAIATELKIVITTSEEQLISKVPTSEMTAYNLYLKAEDYRKVYKTERELSSYQTAFNLYNAALESDSTLAGAYVGLSDLFFSRYYYVTYFQNNFLDTALFFAEKALSFDNNLPDAYLMVAVYYFANGDIGRAIDNLDKAISINPNFSDAYFRKGYILTWINYDFIEGIRNYQKALSLVMGNERPQMIRNLARAYLDVGFVEKSRELYEEAYNLDENKVAYHASLCWLEFSAGNIEEAVLQARRATEINPGYMTDLFVYSLLPGNEEEAFNNALKLIDRNKKRDELSLFGTHRIGYAFYMKDRQKEADQFFKEQIKYGEEGIKLNRILTQRRAAHYDLAATYAFLGEKEKAYKLLDEFGKIDFYQLWWITLIKNDPLFDSIRNEEKFQDLIRTMESRHKAEHEKVRKWLEENQIL